MQKSKQYRFVVLSIVFMSLPFAGVIKAQDAKSVPPPSTSLKDRIGIYNWGVDYSSYPASATIDRLNWAAERVAEIGSRTIRVAMPGDIYKVGQMGDDLALAAASPAYDKLFTDPRFKTYLLTCRSSGEVTNTWADGYTESEYKNIRDEIARLGDYFLTNPKFDGKTFIILNWEGDGGIYGYENKQTIWDAYTAWVQSRGDGVKLARQRNPNSAAMLYSGFEFNLVRSPKGLPCGTSVDDPIRKNPLENRCTIDYVAPRVDVDYYSYSSWQTLDVKFQGPDASYKDAIKTDLTFALNLIRQRRPEISEANFIIGEWGIHRTRWGETTVANFVNDFFNAIEEPDGFKVSYAIFWQIIDNVPFYQIGEDGFGLFRSRNGIFNLTRAGETFKRRLAGQKVERWSGGPSIIVSDASGSPEFRLDSALRIDSRGSETPFSARGNRVSIEQGIHQYLMPRDNATGFTESTTSIVAQLPRGLRPGAAAIYVTDGDGVESKAQFVVFNCETCPLVSSVEDERQIDEFYPGVTVTLRGERFSPSGNTVIFEQQTEQRAFYRFEVPRSDVLSESPDQIKVRMPKEMISSRFTAVIVADAAKRESNQFPMRVYEEQVEGSPVISPFRKIADRDTATANIRPGASITIFGGRFSASGNRVIVEQADGRFTLTRDAESKTEITAKLPDALKPGRAQVYVIDAEGRESRAQEIAIARGVPVNRKLIRRGDGRSSR